MRGLWKRESVFYSPISNAITIDRDTAYHGTMQPPDRRFCSPLNIGIACWRLQANWFHVRDNDGA